MAEIVSEIVESLIDHNNLSDLTVGDDHTQYLLLAGRGSRQSLNGVLAFYDGGTQTINGGLTSEVNGALLEFGVNEGSGNRFGGSYTQASQGGFFRFDSRPGQDLLQLYGRPATENSNAGTLALTLRATGVLLLENPTGAFVLNRLTTTQRDALTPINGMLIYNTTLAKFQGYEAGVWTNLI